MSASEARGGAGVVSSVAPALERSAQAGSRRSALILAFASFLVTFDITAVIVALPRIKAALALEVSGFAWVMDAYSLTFTVSLTAAGVLADRFGRRRALLFGTWLFALASAGCGLATGQALLLATRALQGFSSAFVICGCLALLSDRYKDAALRVRAFALVGTVTGAAMAIGPSGGGFVAELLGWRWVFLINLPICALLVTVIPRVVDESRDPSARRIDWLGIATLTGTLTSLIWFLLHGTTLAGIALPAPLAYAIPALGLAAFIASQRLQAQPMLELSLFARPAFVGICLVPLALAIAYWALLVYLPLFLQTGLGQSLDSVSYWMLAATLPMFLLPFAGAPILLRLGARRFFSAGLVWVGLGALVMAQASRTASLPLGLLGMLLCGSGAAVLNSQISGAIMSYAPKERSGTVSAIATILRQGGFASGIAMLGAILSSARPAAEAPGAAAGAAAAADFLPVFLVAGAVCVVMATGIALLLRGPATPAPK
jgi:MFS family permease